MTTASRDPEAGEANVEELPSLASLAAVELDDLLIGRESPALEAVPRLARALTSWVRIDGHGPPTLQLDQSRVFVINRAFDDSSVVTKVPATVAELVRSTSEVTQSLEQVGVGTADAEQLKRLRTFCLALSRRAASLLYGTEESEPHHPFRR